MGVAEKLQKVIKRKMFTGFLVQAAICARIPSGFWREIKWVLERMKALCKERTLKFCGV